MSMPLPVSTTALSEYNDDVYEALLAGVRGRFERITQAGGPLFTTDATSLFDVFLGALPESLRQHHTCNACRRFVDTYGGLVALDADGDARAVLWDAETTPDPYRASVMRLQHLVTRAKVSGVFLTDEAVWGLPVNKDRVRGTSWRHLAVTPAKTLLYKSTAVRTAHQASAEKREDYGILQRALAEFSLTHVEQAVTLLQTDSLYRSEKCLGVATWLRDLHTHRNATQNVRQRDHLTWSAVATAPAGFCHVRATMIGTLLEDLANGLPFEDVAAKFKAKMHPLQYQRPQAPPTAGNIAQGEKVIQAMGAAASLRRRYARMGDILAFVWRPSPPAAPPVENGVFGHLKAKGAAVPAAPLNAPPVTMTFEKFARVVLPDARRIEFYAPAQAMSYFAFVTASDPAAPPILQWDREVARNPVSWYVYNGGSMAETWGLRSGQWFEVKGITSKPMTWLGGTYPNHADAACFLLDGARDSRAKSTHLCLFSECLRSELHAIRATIEAHSLSGRLEGADESDACGVAFTKGGPWTGARLRVTPKSGPSVDYLLDRWD